MPHSIPTTHSNEQKIIQDGRRNLPSILFAKGGTNIYIYPENLRAKAMLWLWPLRDVAIIGTGFILSVLALAQSGFLPPLVATFLFAFLSIRVEDASILDFLRYAVNFLFLKQQLYGDNVFEKHGINRDRTGDREKTRYLRGKQGIFTRDRALIRPGFIRHLETRASTRSASFFHALVSPRRPRNGGGAAGAHHHAEGRKTLIQGRFQAKKGRSARPGSHSSRQRGRASRPLRIV